MIHYIHTTKERNNIMGERQKYNLKQELLKKNDRILGKEDGIDRRLSLMGISALTNPAYNNSMRTNMWTSHSRQFLTLIDPHFPKVYFGAENTVGKHSDAYKEIKGNKKVYKKIVKFEKLIEESDYLDAPQFYDLFLYDEEKDLYSVEHRKPCEDLTEIFGFDYNNEVIDSFDEGDEITDGTVLYKSTSYDDSMNYRFGKHARVMYTLDPSTFEDAAKMSDEFANEFISPEVETIEIGLNDNDFLLNMFGDDIEHYQSLPKLGQRIDGVLAVSRRLFNNQIIYDFKNKNLSKIMDGDNIYYDSGVVLDYTIYCNNPDMPNNTFNKDILRYLKHQKQYWKEIHKTCKTIMKSGSKYTREIDYMYKRAKEMLDDTNSRWKEGDSEFSNVIIQVLVERHVGCQPGQKLTPRYGNKSVISEIVPKEEMPYYYDENGNKIYAQILLNLLAIINRTTAYPLFELALTFIEDKCARHLRTLKTRKEQEDLFFEFLNDFDPDYAKESRLIYNRLSTKEKNEYMKCVAYGDELYSNGIFLRDIPFYETTPIFYRIMNIYKKYDWLKTDRVYIEKWGREIPILNKYRISEMYFVKLKQTSLKNFSARSMGAVNSKGLPERSYKSRSHLEKHSTTPIRFGEYETLNFSIGQETDDHALFHALYRTSIKGRQDLAKIIMDPNKNEGDISDTYDSRTAEIFSVIFLSLSFGLEFTDEDNELNYRSKDNMGTHLIGGKGYFCSDFTAMMLERTKEIADSIIQDSAMMDLNELKDAVRDKLLASSHLLGTNDEDEIDEIMNLYYN